MKYLETHDEITLNDYKEYIVLDSVIVDDNNFVYLVDKNDPQNQKISMVSKEDSKIRVDEIDLSDTDNREIIGKILEELTVDAYKFLKKEGVINEN